MFIDRGRYLEGGMDRKYTKYEAGALHERKREDITLSILGNIA